VPWDSLMASVSDDEVIRNRVFSSTKLVTSSSAPSIYLTQLIWLVSELKAVLVIDCISIPDLPNRSLLFFQ
jgi:hypothetical protein